MYKFISERFEEVVAGSIITRNTSTLYLVDNRYYEVCHEVMGTSGGAYSTTWSAERWTEEFASLKEVQERYGLHYFSL